jgi:uncharacterized protein (DUF1501 family)
MTVLSRRKFLVGSGLAGITVATGVGAGWGLDRLLASAPVPASAAGGSGTAGPLVLLTLYGGNDGLNTVVPYTDPAYRSLRPDLGYSASEVHDLGEGLGLNPKMPGFARLWQQGQLAVVRGVGYPNPNLSHFASMDIWQTANPTDGTGPGWLGRWLDRTGDDPLRAVSVGNTLPPALRGEQQSATALIAPSVRLPGDSALQSGFAALQRPGSDRTGLAAAVASTGADLLEVGSRLDALHVPSKSAATARGGRDLASQLAVVAALIQAGAPTRVYQVSAASFDTHAGERTDQESLLGDVDNAVTAFLGAVSGHPAGAGVVVMTVSEFGRRPAQNGSGGTDHGAASCLFVAGPKVKGGRFYGEQPSLTRLDADGNLVYNVDFRSVYATVLERVLGFDSRDVLGGGYPDLGFV